MKELEVIFKTEKDNSKMKKTMLQKLKSFIEKIKKMEEINEQ